MVTKVPFAPEIASFFKKSLPGDQDGNVLALSEIHTTTEHVHYLHEHLSTLKEEHHLGTIGIERPAYINVLLWAYQDGTLLRLLKSQEAVEKYFVDVFTNDVLPRYRDSVATQAYLYMRAMDEGIRVVAFDARSPIEENYQGHQPGITHINKSIADYAAEEGVALEEAHMRLRVGDVEFPSGMPEGYTAMQIQYLMEQQPALRKRLTKMERIIELGRAKEIGSDALAATLFYACADPTKNSITISGFGHANTKGYKDKNDHELIHGTFPDHIELLTPEHGKQMHVTNAFLASTGNIARLQEYHAKENPFGSANLYMTGWKYLQHCMIAKRDGQEIYKAEDISHNPFLRETPTALIDIEKRTVEDMAQPEEKETVDMKMRFRKPGAIGNPERVAQRMNPLRIAAMRDAYNAVHADWNPGLAEQKYR